MPQAGAPASDSEDEDAKAKELGFENIADLRESVNHAVLVWVPRVMFVLLPLFAWLVALAYGRIDPNYLHHLIFAVHVHAAWFAAAAIAKAAELLSRPDRRRSPPARRRVRCGVHGSGIPPRVRRDTPIRSRESHW